MSSLLVVPGDDRNNVGGNLDGANIPGPTPSPSASPNPAAMEDVASAAASSASSTPASSPADQVDIGPDPHSHARHPRGARLTAEEERVQFARLYKSQLTAGEQYILLEAKWFESWMAYSGFDRQEADNRGYATANGSPSATEDMEDTEAASGGTTAADRRGGGERPGYIDCSSLLREPADTIDLSTPLRSSAAASSSSGATPAADSLTIRSQWIDLREDAQEGVDFVALNYDAVLRLCEWYGGGPLIVRTVVELGLSAVETIELHPQILLITPIDPQTGEFLLGQRRVKTYPKAMLLSELLGEYKLKGGAGLSPELAAKVDARAWRRRTSPLDPNVQAEMTLAGESLPTGPISAIQAAAMSREDFVRAFEPCTKAEVASKLEFLEWDRGTEIFIETRLPSPTGTVQPWKRVGSGLKTRDWKNFQVGDIMDACDPELSWYQAEVQALAVDPSTGVPLIHLHYLNWSVKYDHKQLALTPAVFTQPYASAVTRFAEKYSYTNAPHVPNLPKKPVPAAHSYDYVPSLQRQNSVGTPEVRGAVGLRNLGNTCFMNSTLQCMANTPGLTEFFTSDKYQRQINRTNVLGFKGKIAEEYGAMLKEIWSGQYSTVTPRGVKQVIGDFNPRFSGYAQQDSQELLGFLLDGLHEDLNRVLTKPNTTTVESNGRPDAVVAKESWERHLMRNQSVIVDACGGQYKSTLVCPKCDRQSVTFDPFLYLTVPLPVETTRELPIIVVQNHIERETTAAAAAAPTPASASSDEVSIAPKKWPMKIGLGLSLADLKVEVADQMSAAPKSAGLSHIPVDSGCLLGVEVYQSKIFKVLAADFAPSKIGKSDVIVFYHIPEMKLNHEKEQFTTLQCVHTQLRYNRPDRFGIPIVLALPTDQLKRLPMSLLRATIRRTLNTWMNHGLGWNAATDVDTELYDIFLTDRTTEQQIMPLPYRNAAGLEDFEVNIQDPVTEYHQTRRTGSNGMAFQLHWKLPAEALADKLIQSSEAIAVPAHIRAQRDGLPKKTGLDLSDCLEAWSKQETLRLSEAWYCPTCKDHIQATKKLDLWKVPDIFIVVLKRFVYDTYRRDKIDSNVDFPVEGLDLTNFIANPDDRNGKAAMYDLYAVSNHYGGMGGGHYTAVAKNLANKQWYNLDDSSVSRVNPQSIKTPAAYVLFYRRRAAKFNL